MEDPLDLMEMVLLSKSSQVIYPHSDEHSQRSLWIELQRGIRGVSPGSLALSVGTFVVSLLEGLQLFPKERLLLTTLQSCDC